MTCGLLFPPILHRTLPSAVPFLLPSKCMMHTLILIQVKWVLRRFCFSLNEQVSSGCSQDWQQWIFTANGNCWAFFVWPLVSHCTGQFHSQILKCLCYPLSSLRLSAEPKDLSPASFCVFRNSKEVLDEVVRLTSFILPLTDQSLCFSRPWLLHQREVAWSVVQSRELCVPIHSLQADL